MRLPLVFATLAMLAAGPCLGQEAQDAGTSAAIQSTIRQQLDAFKAGDGVTAESFASPGIREKFPDPTAFMGMVRQAYGPLIAPRATQFGELSQTPLGLVQKLTVVDGSGQSWTAAYVMTLVDGTWRISGCYMLKADSISA